MKRFKGAFSLNNLLVGTVRPPEGVLKRGCTSLILRLFAFICVCLRLCAFVRILGLGPISGSLYFTLPRLLTDLPPPTYLPPLTYFLTYLLAYLLTCLLTDVHTRTHARTHPHLSFFSSSKTMVAVLLLLVSSLAALMARALLPATVAAAAANAQLPSTATAGEAAVVWQITWLGSEGKCRRETKSREGDPPPSLFCVTRWALFR